MLEGDEVIPTSVLSDDLLTLPDSDAWTPSSTIVASLQVSKRGGREGGVKKGLVGVVRRSIVELVLPSVSYPRTKNLEGVLSMDEALLSRWCLLLYEAFLGVIKAMDMGFFLCSCMF